MKKRGIKARLLLVGEGETRGKLEKLVKDKNLFGNVTFCGHQKETEKYYSAFDVFVMPSYYEGLPIVGIEAQAAGLPCIFSDRIDRRVLLIDKAEMISLDRGTEYWSEIIENSQKEGAYDRKEYAKDIEDKGFEIKRVANQITDLLV